jgi:hypothetical protein
MDKSARKQKPRTEPGQDPDPGRFVEESEMRPVESIMSLLSNSTTRTKRPCLVSSIWHLYGVIGHRIPYFFLC